MEQNTQFSVGDRVRIHYRTKHSEFVKIGEITKINSAGTLFGTWGGTQVYPDRQKVEILEKHVEPPLGEKFFGRDRKVILATAEDLEIAFRNVLSEFLEESKNSNKVITRKEVLSRLNISGSTLWRWDKVGYLKPAAHNGAKIMYRESDVNEILNGNR